MIYECAVSLAFTISPLLGKRMHQLHGPLILLDKTNLGFLHGPPILVFKTNFGLVPIITPNFIGLRKHLLIGQLNEHQFFSAFHWSTSDTPPASQCITIQRRKSKTLCGPCIAAITGSEIYFNAAIYSPI